MMINFICLSVAAIGIGMIADRMGLRQAFLWTAISGLIAAPLIFLLPRPPSLNLQNRSTIIQEL
jgi:hypothetical protein